MTCDSLQGPINSKFKWTFIANIFELFARGKIGVSHVEGVLCKYKQKFNENEESLLPFSSALTKIKKDIYILSHF